MRLKSALRRGVAAAVIAGIVVSSGIPAYAGTWNIADGDITVKAGDAEGPNNVKQGDNDFVKDEGDTVITGKSDEHTVTIDTSGGNVDVTFDDLKIDASDKGEAAVRVEGNGDATIELDGKNELKSGGYSAGLEKDGHEPEGTLTIKDDKGKDGSLTAEGGDGGGAGIGGRMESTGSNIKITGGTIEAVGGGALPESAAVCTARAATSRFPAARCRPRAAMRMKICIPPAPARLASATAQARKAAR